MWGLLLLALALEPASASSTCRLSPDKPVIFFDLGEVLIDTSDWGHLKPMPGALAYLTTLRGAGYPLALITNIPESWGKTEGEKIDHLRSEVDSNWMAGEEPFPWAWFDRVFVPLKDSERKPAPILFDRARDYAEGCERVFEGDSAAEVAAARASGMTGYQVGVRGQPFFLQLPE